MNKSLRLTLFGAPQVCLNGRPVKGFITSKAEAIFYYLVATGRVHTRAALSGLFWPDVGDGQARKNLRDILPNLRQLFGSYLTVTRDQIGFERQSPYWIDIEEFSTHFALKPEEQLAILPQTLALYQGDFLDGFYVREAPEFEEWVLGQREQFRMLYAQGLCTLVEHHLANKNYAEGLVLTRRWLALAPWDERAHRLQMWLLALSGQRSSALAQFETCRLLLNTEVGVEPSAQTVSLYERIRQGQIESIKKASAEKQVAGEKAKTLVRAQLPRTLTSFVGRSGEITHIEGRLLNPAYPLITLVGEGGIGKTRLALAVAEQMRDRFPDGVWFVPLTALALDASLHEQLAMLISSTLKFTSNNASPLKQQVFEKLRHKTMLLVLDNSEKISAATEFILELLQAAPTVKVLATSRQRLNVYGEYAYRLDGLAVPDHEAVAALSVAQVLAYDSIKLFVERAERVSPGFQLTTENQAAIIEICRFVEGLPLGIEWAAALVEELDCRSLADTLVKNYAILATSAVDLSPRHRSIQTMLAYSWQFLTEIEAAILAQCAIFRGGFTPKAATAITGATLEQLQRLVELSLLRRNEQMRFDMHELVRQYALSQLQNLPGQELETARRHSVYFTDLLHAWQTDTAVAQCEYHLQQDLHNFQSAWDWALTHEEWCLVEKSIAGLFTLYRYVGAYHKANHIATSAMKRIKQSVPRTHPSSIRDEILILKLQLQQTDMLFRLGENVCVAQLAQAALQVGQQLHLNDVQAEAYLTLAWIEFRAGQWLSAKKIAAKSLAFARRADDTALEAQALNLLGICLGYGRAYGEARSCLQQSLALTQRLHLYMLESTVHINLGEHYAMSGEYTQAFYHFHQALTLAHTHQYCEDIGVASYNLGNLAQGMGEWTTAQRHFEYALNCLTQIGETYFASLVRIYWGRLHYQRGDLETALIFCQQAQQQCRLNGYHDIEPRAWNQMGKILVAQQRFTEAEDAYRQVLALTMSESGQTDRWLAQAGLAELYSTQSQPVQALTQVEALWPSLRNLQWGDPYEQPFELLWICYKVLYDWHKPLARTVLQYAHQQLYQQAMKIESSELRDSFLECVPTHRAILKACNAVPGDRFARKRKQAIQPAFVKVAISAKIN